MEEENLGYHKDIFFKSMEIDFSDMDEREIPDEDATLPLEKITR